MWKSIFLAVLLMACATASRGQDRRLCFEPGSLILTPEGYAEAREVAADAAQGEAFLRYVELRAPRASRRTSEAQLELMRAGVAINRIKTIEDDTVSDCLPVSTVASEKPYMALWHYWGPYFEHGSDQVPVAGRLGLRYIVVGYRPGERRYCLEGHSDTSGSGEDNAALSRRRAENVARELVRQGVRWEDIEIRASGETRLARATADGVPEPLNRRVSVDVRMRCPATSD